MQNMSLAELGMDSMMAIEIKQTLETEFDILLTKEDIRNLTVAKIKKMINEQKQASDVIETDTNNLNELRILIQRLNNSDLNPDIYVELTTKRDITEREIFLIPGIDGCANIYKQNEIMSNIKSMAICLQHSALNMPGTTRSIMKSATYLLPVRNNNIIYLK